MASTGKRSASNIAVWVIIVLLIIGLAGFGATGFGGSIDSIGKVGKTDISVTRYANTLQQELRRVEQATGQRITLAEARNFGLDQAVLAQVVALTALEDEADELGISVGDEAVRDQILQIPGFLGLDGQFDRASYEFALQNAGLNTAEFEDTIRAELSRALLQQAVTGGVSTPQALTQAFYDFARETRDIAWMLVGPSDLQEPIATPSDADLRSFYEENIDRFSLPERRQITYAWVTPDRIAEDMDVDEDTLRRLYEERLDEFVVPERRLVERLVFGTTADAEAALAAIADGSTDFDSLVAERGLDLADIDLGDVSESDLGDAGEAVFALTEPGIAGPATSALGPALFRMNAILAARETSFEEAVPLLTADAARDMARRQIDSVRDEMDDLLASGATLEELADESIMTLGKIDWWSAVLDGVAGYEAFREAARSVSEDDFPELIDLSDDGLLALRLDGVLAQEAQPFEDVETDVQSSWEDAEQDKASQAHAAALVERLNAGGRPEDEGITLAQTQGLSRDGFLEGALQGLVTAAFELEPGTWRSVDTLGGAAILTVERVHPASDSPDAEAEMQALSGIAANGYAQDLLGAFTRATEADAGLSLDQAAIAAVHAQFQ